MEKLVNAIQDEKPNMSTSDKNSFLTLIKNSDKVLQETPANELYATYEKFQPSQHTLGCLTILEAISSMDKPDAMVFMQIVKTFISECNVDAIKLLPEKFHYVCMMYAETCRTISQPLACLRSLAQAIKKLAPTPEYLTPIHSVYCQMCLLAKNYSLALSVLNQPVVEIDVKQTGLTPKASLLYFYYGGMLYLGLKQYQNALDFFLTAITSPAQTLSAIVAESFKKYVLCSLLVYGKVHDLPRYTPSAVRRSIKHSTHAYFDLVKAFASDKPDDLKETLEKSQPVFVHDKNAGLAKQVMKAYVKRSIQRLTQTYLTLSLKDIATMTGLKDADDAEEILFQMIVDGEIHAEINQKDAMVSFAATAQESADTTSDILQRQIAESIALSEKIEEVHSKVLRSQEYQSKMIHHERLAESAPFRETDPTIHTGQA
eukprot:NODE_427_length_1515_cov_101.566282_g395_i0.p1 GENE.NODE_427_length_1515_cov_101.566282_g395_i0~~NODE_427_length_1515_cov_101.566282_g395_i0.p1  ORF type:complete len:458 (+),score=103.21 NODE_427_length_1515_cov_101.566282_g395_i0:86-1375(+)